MTGALRTAAVACVFTIFLGSPLLAQDADGGAPALPAGDEAPRPVPSPERPEPADDPAPEADEAAGEDDSEADPLESAESPDPPDQPEPPEPEDPAELRACRAALRGLGAVFTQNDEIVAAGEGMDGCGVTAPFAVTEILPDVTLAPATEMRCETALQLARWVKEEVQPAAEALDGFGAVTALNHGSTYVCRPRNNIEDAKISEHAKGNAIDIMSFTFESGETVAVSPKAGDGTPAEVFQKAVGSGACLYFTTVLGPGSDPFHNDHLHLDVVERGSGYRLCQAP